MDKNYQEVVGQVDSVGNIRLPNSIMKHLDIEVQDYVKVELCKGKRQLKITAWRSKKIPKQIVESEFFVRRIDKESRLHIPSFYRKELSFEYGTPLMMIPKDDEKQETQTVVNESKSKRYIIIGVAVLSC